MRLILLTLLFVSIESTSAMAQNLKTSDEKEVYRTIVAIGSAWTQNNLDTLNKYIDAGYIHNDVRGQKQNRIEWLAYVKDRKEKGLTNPGVEFEDVHISIYGNLAIVTGINIFSGQAYTSNDKATNNPRKIRFMQVLKKQNGFWKRLAFQATYIDNP